MKKNLQKIFFAPNYYYLSLPDFESVIARLNLTEPEIDTFILKITPPAPISSNVNYTEEYFRERRLKAIPLDLAEDEDSGGNLPQGPKGLWIRLKRKFASWSSALNNFRKIGSFFRENRPDMVIVTSDLGNMHIRLALEYCAILNIPILIYYSYEVPLERTYATLQQTIVHLFSKYFGKLLYRFRFPLIRFIRGRYFLRETIGTFALNALIATPFKSNREKLEKGGVGTDRIILIRHPECAIEGTKRETILQSLGLREGSRIITFFTECIQDVYGLEYVKNLHRTLGGIFQKLSSESNIVFIIKPHPREIPTYQNDFHLPDQNVIGRKILFAKNLSVRDAIEISDICIAHYSRTLITAILRKKLVLSINIKGERRRTFVPESESPILEAKTCDELENKIKLILTEKDEAERIRESLTRLSAMLCPSDREITSVIRELLEEGKEQRS